MPKNDSTTETSGESGMETVVPTTGFVTYVGPQAVSASVGSPIDLPSAAVAALRKQGMVQSLEEWRAEQERETSGAYAAAEASVAERNRDTTGDAGDARTNPAADYADTYDRPAPVDVDSVKGNRAAKIIKDSTGEGAGSPVPAHVPAPVDVGSVRGDRAADIIKESTKDPRTNPAADDAATYTRPADVDEDSVRGDRAADVVKATTGDKTKTSDDDDEDAKVGDKVKAGDKVGKSATAKATAAAKKTPAAPTPDADKVKPVTPARAGETNPDPADQAAPAKDAKAADSTSAATPRR